MCKHNGGSNTNKNRATKKKRFDDIHKNAYTWASVYLLIEIMFVYLFTSMPIPFQIFDTRMVE